MNKNTTVKELPDSEKPYEKFLAYGPEYLSDAELLAVIIRSGTSGQKSVEVAQNLLNGGHRNLLNLYDMPFEKMQKIRGIGPIKAIQLKCVAELSRRIAQTRSAPNVCMTNPQTIAEYYMEKLRHECKEHLMVCMFDNKCHMKGDKLLSIGSANETIVSPGEVFAAAINCHAAHLILVHNHPSGIPSPSRADDIVTKRIFECGQLMGIPLSDHIIIGDHSYFSYRENNRIVV